ncbi:MAG TPA: FAD-linked oxidase C-terminal domain-containing protein, partial [Motiliproteus sp.]
CQGLPISASAYRHGVLCLRFSAHPAVLKPIPKHLGGEEVTDAETFWDSWRDQRLDFFHASAPLWRISLPPGQHLPAGLRAKAAAGSECWEWGGQQHWLASNKPASALRAELQPCRGSANLYRDHHLPGAEQLAPALLALHQRLKHAFDPRHILNPLLTATTAAEV